MENYYIEQICKIRENMNPWEFWDAFETMEDCYHDIERMIDTDIETLLEELHDWLECAYGEKEEREIEECIAFVESFT